MFIYEMFIIGVGQAGAGPKEDVKEILSPWEEEGKRGMQGICVEQVEQVARLKRLPLMERGRSHPPTPPLPVPSRPHPMGWNANPNKTSWEEQAPATEPVVCVAMLVSSVHKAFWGGAA